MKRLFIILIILVLLLALFTIPISASTEESSEVKSGIDYITDIYNYLTSGGHAGELVFAVADKSSTALAITTGGFNAITEGSQINKIISSVYNFLYPIGFIVMLICWGFGLAKNTISSSLDIKDKNSIIHSVISLILSLAAMSLAPQILTLLISVSYYICQSIYEVAFGTLLLEALDVNGNITLNSFLNPSNPITYGSIVCCIIELIYKLNILWIGLLQCLSPIFMGLMANKSTRKISFTFIREYFKALLVPILTEIYFLLTCALLQETFMGGNLLFALVFAISTVGIANKKMDKLIK